MTKELTEILNKRIEGMEENYHTFKDTIYQVKESIIRLESKLDTYLVNHIARLEEDNSSMKKSVNLLWEEQRKVKEWKDRLMWIVAGISTLIGFVMPFLIKYILG